MPAQISKIYWRFNVQKKNGKYLPSYYVARLASGSEAIGTGMKVRVFAWGRYWRGKVVGTFSLDGGFMHRMVVLRLRPTNDKVETKDGPMTIVVETLPVNGPSTSQDPPPPVGNEPDDDASGDPEDP